MRIYFISGVSYVTPLNIMSHMLSVLFCCIRQGFISVPVICSDKEPVDLRSVRHIRYRIPSPSDRYISFRSGRTVELDAVILQLSLKFLNI